MSKGKKVISHTILNVNTLRTLLPHSLIAEDWYTSAVSEELCLQTAAWAFICSQTGDVQIEQPEEFYMWLSTMAKAAFIFGCWKKLQTRKLPREKEFPLAVPRTPMHRGGTVSSKSTARAPQPRALPSGARFPTTTRHSFTRRRAKRSRSQQLFAIAIALLPVLLCGERCRMVEPPPD